MMGVVDRSRPFVQSLLAIPSSDVSREEGEELGLLDRLRHRTTFLGLSALAFVVEHHLRLALAEVRALGYSVQGIDEVVRVKEAVVH
jgi:hypothetical protein